MNLDQRGLVPSLALLVEGRRRHHLATGLRTCSHGLLRVAGHLVDRLVEDLVAELEHLHEIERDEVIS